jgi:proteasome assembly chaperone 3
MDAMGSRGAAGPASSSGPGSSLVCSTACMGVRTDLAFNAYEDAMVLVVTQLGTTGTVVAARQDTAFDGSTTYSTSVLMGKRDEPALILCARRIVEDAGQAGYAKPMVICLALKEHSPQMVRAVVQAVGQRSPWGAPRVGGGGAAGAAGAGEGAGAGLLEEGMEGLSVEGGGQASVEVQ